MKVSEKPTKIKKSKKKDSFWKCTKCGFSSKANREDVLNTMMSCPKCAGALKELKKGVVNVLNATSFLKEVKHIDTTNAISIPYYLLEEKKE